MGARTAAGADNLLCHFIETLAARSRELAKLGIVTI